MKAFNVRCTELLLKLSHSFFEPKFKWAGGLPTTPQLRVTHSLPTRDGRF